MGNKSGYQLLELKEREEISFEGIKRRLEVFLEVRIDFRSIEGDLVVK